MRRRSDVYYRSAGKSKRKFRISFLRDYIFHKPTKRGMGTQAGPNGVECCNLYVRRFLGGEPLPKGDDVLEFRLLYQGALLGASRSDTRADHKHSIRREFHKQLKRLWSSKSPLKERFESPLIRYLNATEQDQMFITRRKELAEKFSYHGYTFVPVVMHDLFLTCSLDILFLRPEEPSLLIEGGDIDNRVKTVFDALRIPKPQEAYELSKEFPPTDDEKPMYCLMEDDKMVSGISVIADHLLLLPGAKELGANDIFLVVYVKVKPTKLVVGNIDFA